MRVSRSRIASRLQALACTAVALLLIQGASNAATMTPDDVAKLRLVVDARISPDGEQIAYTLAVPRAVGSDDNGPA